MAQFRFRLATLLRLREAARDEKRAHLAEAYRAEEVVHTRLSELKAEIDSLKQRYVQGISPGAVNVDALVDTQRYEFIVRAEQTVIQGQLQALRDEVEKRREALVQADRDVRVLEKLRDAQLERFQAEEAAAEVKTLDEVAARSTSREVV